MVLTYLRPNIFLIGSNRGCLTRFAPSYGKRKVSKSDGQMFVSDLRPKLERTSEIGTYV